MIKVPVFLVLVGVIFAALNYVIGFAVDYFDEPPIRILAGEIEGPKNAQSGGQLRIKLVIHRDRLCHTVVARYIHSPAGDVVMYQESIGGDAPIGTSRYAFTYPVPPGLSPGRYTFKGVINSTCGSRRYVETTPPLTFTISPE